MEEDCKVEEKGIYVLLKYQTSFKGKNIRKAILAFNIFHFKIEKLA